MGRHHEVLLDLLCDTYNRHYKTDKKKRDLLQRMCQHHNKVIRSAAWQRTASWQQDLGNFRGGARCPKEAMRADPDNPSHALLELVLLVSSTTDRPGQATGRLLVRARETTSTGVSGTGGDN